MKWEENKRIDGIRMESERMKEFGWNIKME